MKRKLVLSIDYELFGNGTGDVLRHMVEPTERMARICEMFDMPLTVFLEVEEYLAFNREREALTATLGYDPAAAIHAQALDLIRRGHDIELHLHPEWMGAVLEHDQWHLRSDKRTVDSLFDTAVEVSAFIGERKAVIDEIYEAAGSSRRVRGYRCGAFCAQPGGKLLMALSEHGIVIESSAVKGMVRKDGQVHLDYTGVPKARRHWQVTLDVATEDTAGHVTEIPVYSRMGRRVQQLTPRRLLAKFFGNVPKRTQQEMVRQFGMGRTPASVLRFLVQQFPIKLDFHNMSARQLLRWIREVPPAPEGDLDVIVLIGHSKEHFDDANFTRFLVSVAADPALEVVSMSEISEMIVKMGSVS